MYVCMPRFTTIMDMVMYVYAMIRICIHPFHIFSRHLFDFDDVIHSVRVNEIYHNYDTNHDCDKSIHQQPRL